MTAKHPIIIINGPTGVGKTTIIKRLISDMPFLHTGVTYTTREARKASKEDKDMRHVSSEEFLQMRDDGKFLEWAEFSGNFYATSKDENLEILNNHPLLLNIEVIGTFQIKEQFPKTVTIYVLPEDIEQLKKHLKGRSFSADELDRRMKSAEWSISQSNRYDYQVINKEGEIEETIAKIKEIITSETGLS